MNEKDSYMKDFKNLAFEIIDLSINASPDLFVNLTSVSFTKKVLEDLNYPANVQYGVNDTSRVFCIRASKSNEAKTYPFSKPRSEQKSSVSSSNKSLVESIKALMPEHFNPKKRYKITGHFVPETRTMYYDLDEAVEELFRQPKDE